MARTVTDIKNQIGATYMSLPAVQTVYSLTSDDLTKNFDDLFSIVSIESILFYAFAVSINFFEQILDVFQAEIQTTVDNAFVMNKAWWKAQCIAYQKGDNLVLNAQTFKYEYAIVDATKQIVKRVAVRETLTSEGVCKVKIMLAGESSGVISPLSGDDLNVFKTYYAEQIKGTGILLDIISDAGDVMDFEITINYNPLLLTSTGVLISDNVTMPVPIAVQSFIDDLNNNTFGGELNITALIDTIQAVTGVVDAKITSVKKNTVDDVIWGTIDSTNGWFILGDLTGKLTYQPQMPLS